MEIGGNSINFLDLTISIQDDHHSFDIYLKPTYTDITIHGSSYCPPAHKFAAYYFMTNRLLSVPLSPVALNTEVNTIKCIANNNNIRLNIDNIIRKKLTTRSLDAATSLPRDRKVLKKEKLMRLPYLGTFSSTLRGVLKTANRRPDYYSLNTTRQNLCRLKDPIPQTQRSGVYRITCGDCPATYIGETGRQI